MKATKKTTAPKAAKKSAGKRASAATRSAKTAAKQRPTARRSAAKKITAKKTTARKKTRAARRPSPRADYGAPTDGFFAKQPPHLRPILDTLRELVAEAAPDADSALKWGQAFYSIGGETMCALGGHKAHVNLILPGRPGTYDDPEGRLAGAGSTGRHLKLTSLDELPREAVRGWLRTAAERARKG